MMNELLPEVRIIVQLKDRIRELEAERDELRKRADTRTYALNEAEALVQSLQNKWASRPLSSEDQGQRIVELETMLRRVQTNSHPVWQYKEILALLGPSTAEPPTPNSAPVSSKSEGPHCPTCSCGLTPETEGKSGG